MPRASAFTAAIKAAKVGDSILTTQSDRNAAAYAIRAGFTCKTRNLWAIPCSVPHGENTAQAVRVCEVTITGLRTRPRCNSHRSEVRMTTFDVMGDGAEARNAAPKHTPTPWFVNGPWHIQADTHRERPDIVAHVTAPRSGDLSEREANAALIVRAVNSHAALVDALEAVTALDDGEGIKTGRPLAVAIEQARAALKLARGE